MSYLILVASFCVLFSGVSALLLGRLFSKKPPLPLTRAEARKVELLEAQQRLRNAFLYLRCRENYYGAQTDAQRLILEKHQDVDDVIEALDRYGLLDEEKELCTRSYPHVCTVNGPCNGYPKEPNSFAAAVFERSSRDRAVDETLGAYDRITHDATTKSHTCPDGVQFVASEGSNPKMGLKHF